MPLGMGLEEVLEEEVALSGELTRNSSESDSNPRPLLLFKEILESIGLDDAPLLDPARGPPFNRALSKDRTESLRTRFIHF